MRNFLIILALTFPALSVRANYVPSVGIPDPAQYWEGGLDPVDSVRPADPAGWTAETPVEVAGFYYIDNTEPGNTNTGRTYGRPGAARSTMPTGTIAAGSVIVIRGGPYTGSGTNFTLLGTSSQPIWISGDPDTRTNFRFGWRIYQATYAFIENFHWTNLDRMHLDISQNSDAGVINRLAVRNCRADGNGNYMGLSSAIFRVSGRAANPIQHLVYYRCKGFSGGDASAVTEYDIHAFSVGSYHQWCWWIECETGDNQGDGYGNGHDANHTAHHLFWDRCADDGTNREDSMDLKEVHAGVISGCDFLGSTVIHYGPSTGQGPWGLWFINNALENVGGDALISTALWNAVQAEAASDSLVYPGAPDIGYSHWIGNLIRNSTQAMAPDRAGGHFKLWNNTLVGNTNGLICTGTIDSLDMRGNIVVDGTTQLRVDSSGVRAASAMTHSLFYRSGGSVSLQWGSTYSSVAALIAGTTVGDNSVEADPQFVNAAAGNFALQEGSPARNAGYDWRSAATAQYNADFGTSLTDAMWLDRHGVAFDATPDIGALQYSDNGAVPDTPTLSSASALSTTRIRLSLAAAGTGEAATSIRIERSTTGSGSGFAFVTSVPADTTQWDDENLSPGITYYYRAQAVNAGGPSSYTGEVSEQTNEEAGRSGPSGRAALVRRRH